MGANPVYNLTWGEYGTSLISAVQLLRCHGELVDVTLAAGGRTFHAHKVVLCAASPFLLDLLKSTTCKHPVVMLAGVQAADLEALLEFVYRGEVSIDQNQLPSLLQAAHCLNIQGLAPSPGPIHNEPIHQHPVKTAIDIPKTPEAAVQTELQVVHTPVVEEEMPVKRKKRAKRLRSPSTSIHSEKVYIQAGITNESIQEAAPNVNAPVWTQQMNIINVATSAIDTLPNQSSIAVQNIGTPISNNVQGSNPEANLSGTKMKGASDQPGACPLCGAMLRQARNLRRHLLTSCKYRMLNGVQQNPNPAALQVSRDLTQLQAVPIENVEGVTQDSVEHLENKPVALTPISCAELISSNTNIISINSSDIH